MGKIPLILAAMILASGCIEPTNPKDVKTFQDCANAGYPIQETYPRTCKTPDGRTITSDTDTFETTRYTNCGDDSECTLVNVKNGFSCCWTGRCDQIDYSMGQWQSVNKEWYQREKTNNCPKETECGPAPMCPTKAPIGAYKPACINSKCVKIAIT
jgi:hypothetical protein